MAKQWRNPRSPDSQATSLFSLSQNPLRSFPGQCALWVPPRPTDSAEYEVLFATKGSISESLQRHLYPQEYTQTGWQVAALSCRPRGGCWGGWARSQATPLLKTSSTPRPRYLFSPAPFSPLLSLGSLQEAAAADGLTHGQHHVATSTLVASLHAKGLSSVPHKCRHFRGCQSLFILANVTL